MFVLTGRRNWLIAVLLAVWLAAAGTTGFLRTDILPLGLISRATAVSAAHPETQRRPIDSRLVFCWGMVDQRRGDHAGCPEPPGWFWMIRYRQDFTMVVNAHTQWASRYPPPTSSLGR